MVYAIVEIGGSQIIVEPGKFYDVNYMHLNPGDVIRLNRVLLFAITGKVNLGSPCLHKVTVCAKVLRHFRGSKLTVFKVKRKKNTRTKRGHRQLLTRLLIEKIVG